MATNPATHDRNRAQVVADVPAATSAQASAATNARAAIHAGVVGDADAHQSSPVRSLLA